MLYRSKYRHDVSDAGNTSCRNSDSELQRGALPQISRISRKVESEDFDIILALRLELVIAYQVSGDYSSAFVTV